MNRITAGLKRKHSLKRLTLIAGIFAILCPAGCRKPVPRQILLISIDTLRADHLGVYGYGRNTSPHIDALAAESRIYTHAYPAGCWTMPSHMSLLTGTLPSRHGVNMDWNSSHQGRFRVLNKKVPMISTIIREHRPTMTTIKFAKLPGRLGFSRGFDLDVGGDPFRTEKRYKQLLNIIREHRGDEFFLFVHTWMVHAPYSSARFLRDGSISNEDREFVFHLRDDNPPDANARLREFIKSRGWFTPGHCMDLYDGGIHRVDEGIGRLMADLKRMGLYKEMMIVLVSDHGEHFSEHVPDRFYDDHGKDFYEEYIHVPLIIKFPRFAEKGRVNTPVSLADVVPTLLECLRIPAHPVIQGRVLPKNDMLKEKVPVISEAISIAGIERKMIRINAFKLILSMENPGGPGRMNWSTVHHRRLFNLETDPGEFLNLAARPPLARITREMEKRLARSLLESVRLNTSEQTEALSEETRKQLETLGYL